jgi:hypothetical protein
MGAYVAKYQPGMKVRIASMPELEEFKRSWRFHNPLIDSQMEHADVVATVRDVGFYHGGDPIYQLDGVPGVWHEQVLRSA